MYCSFLIGFISIWLDYRGQMKVAMHFLILLGVDGDACLAGQ